MRSRDGCDVVCVCVLMLRRPPRSTRTDHSFPTRRSSELAELEAVSARRGMAIEWSFVLDAFQAERDQAVTIDTTQIWFKTALRDYVIIDAPGHRGLLKNMVSGAASADAAVVVIDAAVGVSEQSLRPGRSEDCWVGKEGGTTS